MLWFLLWLAALNLRTVSIGVAPVLSLIRADLGISFAQAGALFSLPVVFMGLFATPGSRLADRVGTRQAITLSYLLLIAGGALRAWAPGYWSLLAFTAVFSTGIGLAQPSLARLVREEFPARRATATGVYTTGFVCGAIVAASVTGPLLPALGPASWRGTCLVWAGLAAASLVAWLALARRPRSRPAASRGLSPSGEAARVPRATGQREWDKGSYAIWRDRVAWLITAFFLAQGLVFYTANGWLPSYYQELGLSVDRAGEALALFNLAMLPVALSVTYVSDRLHQRRPFLLGGSLLFLVGQVGLVVAPLHPWWLWMIAMGVGSSAVFAISLVLPIDLLDPRRASATVSLMLTVGYVGVLLGPLSLGALRDLTGTFLVAWVPNLVTGLAMILLALLLPETGNGLRGQSQG
ncbi:MAG: MFS transporter [Chloroflexi bacterium]|nr:MFS transporter [Chloroflexota bacterium]